MIKFEKIEAYGWEPAIRGMRNSHDSWDKSDSVWVECLEASSDEYIFVERAGEQGFWVGPVDQELMLRLSRAGSDHRKFMRMINVYMDIVAPMYWWKEMDTYAIGKVQNSCSTMHSITKNKFTIYDFSHDNLDTNRDLVMHNPNEYHFSSFDFLKLTVDVLNQWRERYLVALKTEEETGLPAKDIWWQIIQLLPSSYNQRRTVMLNYEVLRNIYHARKNHKLDEWRAFCRVIEVLPFSELITGANHPTITVNGKDVLMSVNAYCKVNGLDAVEDIPVIEKHNVTCKEEKDNV